MPVGEPFWQHKRLDEMTGDESLEEHVVRWVDPEE